MNTDSSKDLFSSFITLAAIFIAVAVALLVNGLTSNEKKLLVIGGFVLFVILVSYFLYIINNPKACFPFIIFSSWFVAFEPAPCDVLAGLAILGMILNISLFKKVVLRLSIIDFMFFIFLVLNIHTISNTDSYRYFSITLYLILFFFLISKLSDSYSIIEKQLNFFFVPFFITFLALLVGYVSNILNVNLGPFDVLMEGSRSQAFFKDPNVAGPFLLVTGIYSLARVFNMKAKGKSFFICVYSLSAIGIISTLSRAAILALLFSTFVVLTFSVDTKNILRVFTALSLTILIISIPILYMTKVEYFSRIYDTEFGVQDRIERIEGAITVFKESPLIGTGKRLKREKTAHDSYFSVLTQTGVIGFLCFWCPIVYLASKLLIRCKQCSNETEKVIRLTIGVFLCSHLIFGLAINFLHWRHFWYIAGLGGAAVRLINTEPNK